MFKGPSQSEEVLKDLKKLGWDPTDSLKLIQRMYDPTANILDVDDWDAIIQGLPVASTPVVQAYRRCLVLMNIPKGVDPLDIYDAYKPFINGTDVTLLKGTNLEKQAISTKEKGLNHHNVEMAALMYRVGDLLAGIARRLLVRVHPGLFFVFLYDYIGR